MRKTFFVKSEDVDEKMTNIIEMSDFSHTKQSQKVIILKGLINKSGLNFVNYS